MTETVGFVGLGVMGKPMARNLLGAGYPLVVHSRSNPPVEELVAAGATAATTPAEAAAAADVVITMLPDGPQVEEVFGGEDGIFAAARPGALLIDMSTIAPAVSRSLAATAAAGGFEVLDAPVSGGDVGAREGTLSIMVGGEASTAARARPVLEALGKTIVHVGPAGSGQVVKACNQLLVATTIVATSEALVLGERLGIDAAALLDVLSGGLAGNKVMEVRRPQLLSHEFTPGFKLDLHHKDLEIALGAGGNAGVPLPLTALVQQLVRGARAKGRGGEDHTVLLEAIEELAGPAPASRQSESKG
ncbi:MAG: 2-hydroxy-3-oxopropionate reductase [Actinobacteria bacterium]|nr:2-hydroxy-3-oxopropionate reductase [Actinomycetota bacterium]